MRKEIAFLALLLLLPNALALQTIFQDNFTAKEDIRQIETYKDSIFVTTDQYIQRLSGDNNWARNPEGRFPADLDANSDFVFSGTRQGGSSILLYHQNGTLALSRDIGRWTAGTQLYSKDNQTILVSSAVAEVEGYYRNGTLSFRFGRSKEAKNPDESLHQFDNSSAREFLLDGKSGNGGFFQVADTKGRLVWKTPRKESKKVHGFHTSEGVLIYYRGGLELLKEQNGDPIWKKNVRSSWPLPVVFQNKIAYSNQTHLIFRDLRNGDLINAKQINSSPRKLAKHSDEELIIGSSRGNVSIWDFEGEFLDSINLAKPSQIRVTAFDEDSRKELAVVSGRTVHVIDVRRERASFVNQSLSDTVFVGSGKEMLEAVALNQTSFVSEEFDDVREQVNETGLDPVGVRTVSGLEGVRDVNEAFNTSRPKYYVEDREKAVYVAALAARNNASLTFDREEADRDYSDYSLEELQEKFIEKFEPHHVVVADLDSDKGVLAAYMAVRQGSLPVDFDQEFDYPGDLEDVDAESWNRDNGVIKLDRKIENSFEKIGTNEKTIFSGRYVSILDGPRKLHEDPVEKGLISDPEDGEHFYSDISYGNLDSDRSIEAAAGRYPEKVSDASVLFHRSLERKDEKEAVVASEYLHDNWPVVLLTLGGGMWDGKTVEKLLETQGYETVNLIEHRAKPLEFLEQITGVPGFLGDVNDLSNTLAKFLKESTAKAFKNALIVVKGLELAEHALRFYLEFNWASYSPALNDVELPDDPSEDEFRELVLSILPERNPELVEDRLVSELGDADIVYYQGVGNSSRWVLPNEPGKLNRHYTGENSLRSGEIPEVGKPIVWDNSDSAGKRNGRMKQEFIEEGASSYLGFSSVNYAPYSSHIGLKFLKFGRTVGESYREGVNSLRDAFLVYSPTSRLKVGVREKMEKSLSLYGNPEMKKDPLQKQGLKTTRNCEDNTCNLRISVRPEPEIKETGRGKTVSFQGTDYLLEEFAPITPLYVSREPLPESAEILEKDVEQEYRTVENVSMPKVNLLSHGQKFYNRSFDQETFPEEMNRVNRSGKKLVYVQAAMAKEGQDAEVLEAATLKIMYRSPVTLDLEVEEKRLYGVVNSEKSFSGKISTRFDGEIFTRSISIDEGSNKFLLKNLSAGQHGAEAFLYREELLATDREKFTVKQPLEVHLFAPETNLGSERIVEAVVENPNNFAVTENLAVQTGEKVQLGLLETAGKKVTLEPGEQERLRWRISGIEKGETEVSLNGKAEDLRVVDALTLDQKLNPERIVSRTESVKQDYTVERSSGEVKLSVQSPMGRVSVRKSPGIEVKRLETDDFTVREKIKGNRKVQELETEEGMTTRVTQAGVTRVDGSGLGETELDRRIDTLEREVEKLLERYRARASEERKLKIS